MKKIYKYIFLLIGLLISLKVSAYKIEVVNASGGSITGITYDNSGTPVDVAVNTTDIPSSKTITMTVTPDGGKFLSSLKYEEVTSLGNALARRRADRIQTIHNISIKNTTPSYIEAHYGGTYTFTMPENDVIITATFENLTDFDNNENITINLNDNNIGYDTRPYKGNAYTLLVKNIALQTDQQTLTAGKDYKIKDISYNSVSQGANYSITNVGSYIVTIEGIGKYYKTKACTPLTISQITLNVIAEAKSKIYGQADPTLTYTYSGLTGSDVISTAVTGSLSREPGEIVGSYSILIGSLSSLNYNINYTLNTLTINPLDIGSTASGTKAEITLTGPDSDADGLYYNWDGNVKSPEVSVTYNSAAFTSYDPVVTTAEYFPDDVDNKKADIYTVTVTFNGNYTGSISKSYQIRPKIELNNANKWLTFYEPTYNMKATFGLNTYTVQSVTFSGGTGSVVLSSRNGDIRKTVPMMLYRTGDDNIFYPVLESKTKTTWTGVLQDFKHNASDWNLPTGIPEGKDIWILVNDNFIRTNSGTMPAGKCYLELNHTDFPSSITTQASARLRIVVGNDDDDTTGINDVEINTEEIRGEFYNLNGQRVQTPSKGIYIVNGKKVFIK